VGIGIGDKGVAVSVGGVVVGAITPGGTGSGTDDLWILFNSNADAARATSLIRAVTYNNVGARQTGGARALTFTLNHGSGTAIGGSDTAVVTSFVSVAFSGTAGNDIFAGNGGPDTFLLQQGGADQAVGGGDSDGFHFGAAFAAGDSAMAGPAPMSRAGAEKKEEAQRRSDCPPRSGNHRLGSPPRLRIAGPLEQAQPLRAFAPWPKAKFVLSACLGRQSKGACA
jgi:hypothetical protein